MGTLKKIIFQLDLHQRVLIILILPQCLSTQTIPLSPNIGFWIPLSVFKLSTQYPYYSQLFEYSVKNTLIGHTPTIMRVVTIESCYNNDLFLQ